MTEFFSVHAQSYVMESPRGHVLPASRGFSSPGRPGSLEKEAVMAWIYLAIAGVLEIIWAFSMKQSEGFTRLTPSIVTVVTALASFALLALSMKSLPLGTAYTIWTGIGAVGAFAVGIIVLGEQASAMRIVAALLIVSGLVLMKASSPA
jgi:quaternary ammonium compound-resistance protein SugE